MVTCSFYIRMVMRIYEAQQIGQRLRLPQRQRPLIGFQSVLPPLRLKILAGGACALSALKRVSGGAGVLQSSARPPQPTAHAPARRATSSLPPQCQRAFNAERLAQGASARDRTPPGAFGRCSSSSGGGRCPGSRQPRSCRYKGRRRRQRGGGRPTILREEMAKSAIFAGEGRRRQPVLAQPWREEVRERERRRDKRKGGQRQRRPSGRR